MTRLKLSILGSVLLAGFSASSATAQNNPINRQCSDYAKTFKARDNVRVGQPGFYHQEINFGGGGRYQVFAASNANPKYQYRMNAFFYQRPHRGAEWTFKRQAKSALSATHTFEIGARGGQALVQVVKLSDGCDGCSLSVSIEPISCRVSVAHPAPAEEIERRR